ncbi:hypothetical protein SAMN06266787_10696 [Halorubrum ezzemoulense]|uniref:Uncharacterized protein n=1 Tax=Halorubrum ezzemoulense TaxID=337243 RepID=A0A238XRF5_HALEZ|nr:hypothetical protein SAMN06266787_10696 [Halorubrum ezzemoulense]
MKDKIVVKADNDTLEIDDPHPLLKFDISKNGDNDTLKLNNDVKAELDKNSNITYIQ